MYIYIKPFYKQWKYVTYRYNLGTDTLFKTSYYPTKCLFKNVKIYFSDDFFPPHFFCHSQAHVTAVQLRFCWLVLQHADTSVVSLVLLMCWKHVVYTQLVFLKLKTKNCPCGCAVSPGRLCLLWIYPLISTHHQGENRATTSFGQSFKVNAHARLCFWQYTVKVLFISQWVQ